MKKLAGKAGLPVPEYTRKVLRALIIEKESLLNEEGPLLRDFIRDVKEYVLLYRESAPTYPHTRKRPTTKIHNL